MGGSSSRQTWPLASAGETRTPLPRCGPLFARSRGAIYRQAKGSRLATITLPCLTILVKHYFKLFCIVAQQSLAPAQPDRARKRKRKRRSPQAQRAVGSRTRCAGIAGEAKRKTLATKRQVRHFVSIRQACDAIFRRVRKPRSDVALKSCNARASRCDLLKALCAIKANDSRHA